MRRPRRSGPLLFSLAIHVLAGIALVNVVFHYDFSGLRGPRRPAPVAEQITYVATAPAGGAAGGSGASAPAKAKEPARGLVAPVRVPTAIAPAPAPAGGTPGGVAGGTGVGGGQGAATGIVPADPDPRLSADAHQFIPLPKTHGQRVDSALHAMIFAYNDSVAKAAALAGRKPGDWTFEKGGQKWGIDGSKIYLGKFAIPSAVLAALPLRIQGNPGETIADRLVTTRRGEVAEHAQSQYHDDEFKSAVKRIRERKDKERRERLGEPEKTIAKNPGGQ
jgi:hypothetical protein